MEASKSHEGEKVSFVNTHLYSSSSVMTDRSGNLVKHYGYRAYGNERYNNPTAAYDVSKRFTSQILDYDVDLYYYGARFYSPALGRFLQPDPVMPYMQIAAAGHAADGKIPGQYLSGAALQNYLQTDPVGKFLANDPAGRFLVLQVYGISSELNLYTYCGNNPVMLLDPYGLAAKLSAKGYVASVVAIVSGAVFLKTGSPIAGAVFALATAVATLDAIQTMRNPPGEELMKQHEQEIQEGMELYPTSGGKGCPPQ